MLTFHIRVALSHISQSGHGDLPVEISRITQAALHMSHALVNVLVRIYCNISHVQHKSLRDRPVNLRTLQNKVFDQILDLHFANDFQSAIWDWIVPKINNDTTIVKADADLCSCQKHSIVTCTARTTSSIRNTRISTSDKRLKTVIVTIRRQIIT
jgi:hypothetical protein